MLKNKHVLAMALLVALIAPAVVFAEGAQTFKTLVDSAVKFIIQPVIYLIFAVAMVAFLWGVMQYIQSAGDPGKRSEGIQLMIWGIVGLTIMFVVLQLVSILARTFSLDANQIPGLPPPSHSRNEEFQTSDFLGE
ncbi:MAG: hypothetical protein Q8Q18_00895 [bacterium]|nr:hypothetical protein [bacterium]